MELMNGVEFKICPTCAEEIKFEAKKCRFCWEEFLSKEEKLFFKKYKEWISINYKNEIVLKEDIKLLTLELTRTYSNFNWFIFIMLIIFFIIPWIFYLLIAWNKTINTIVQFDNTWKVISISNSHKYLMNNYNNKIWNSADTHNKTDKKLIFDFDSNISSINRGISYIKKHPIIFSIIFIMFIITVFWDNNTKINKIDTTIVNKVDNNIKFQLTENERKQYFLDLVKAEDRAKNEYSIHWINDKNLLIEAIKKQDTFANNYKLEVIKLYWLTEKESTSIVNEALNKDWPLD